MQSASQSVKSKVGHPWSWVSVKWIVWIVLVKVGISTGIDWLQVVRKPFKFYVEEFSVPRYLILRLNRVDSNSFKNLFSNSGFMNNFATIWKARRQSQCWPRKNFTLKGEKWCFLYTIQLIRRWLKRSKSSFFGPKNTCLFTKMQCMGVIDQ